MRIFDVFPKPRFHGEFRFAVPTWGTATGSGDRGISTSFHVRLRPSRRRVELTNDLGIFIGGFSKGKVVGGRNNKRKLIYMDVSENSGVFPPKSSIEK